MENKISIQERIQTFYSKHSIIVDKIAQFVLAFVTFTMINKNIGFMHAGSKSVVAIGLAIICTFFPPVITVLAATALILAHMYALSLGTLAVTAVAFIIMYVFYLRLTPKMGMLILLTAVAFVFKLPFALPVIVALMTPPAALIAILLGAVSYYMMAYVKGAATVIQSAGADGMMTQISAYIKGVAFNKTLWAVIAAFTIAYLVTYVVRRLPIPHAWKVATVVGVIADAGVYVVGCSTLGGDANMTMVALGSVVAVIGGLFLDFMFFNIDFQKAESLQFEDDEYYYYVKAVPKLHPNVAPLEDGDFLDEDLEDEDERPKRKKKKARDASGEQEAPRKKKRPEQGNSQTPKKRKKPLTPEEKERRRAARARREAQRAKEEDVNQVLLTQSLKKDLDMNE